MHNRKKSEAIRSDAENEKTEKKKIAYSNLSDSLMDRRASGELSTEVLAVTGQLLCVNPDFYTVWNYRKEILLSLHAELGLTEEMPAEKLRLDTAYAIRDDELSLSNIAIKKNPKSYGAWYHRQWILDRIHIDVQSELDLCQEYLKADQRNFHCWKYRRYLVEIGGISNESEFEFSTFKIEENFSNYSAFHHRSVYIRALSAPVPELIDQEMTIVENAIFTDPFDQSAFWYYQVIIFICTTELNT
jgi:geranylgeranyl transferase type-2 subunit alpha